MTVNVSNTATTNSWEYWLDRTNELAFAQTYKNVSVGSNTAIGNASISGTFSGGDLVANNTTTSTTNATGALVVKGGAGIAENLNVGGSFDLDGIATFNANVTFEDVAQFNNGISTGGIVTVTNTSIADISLMEDASSGAHFSYNGATNELEVRTGTDGIGGGTKRLTVGRDSGDVDFYDTAGTTEGMRWDASTERLGIGTTTPATALDVTGTATVDGLTIDGTSDINGTMTFQSPADITFDDTSGNELQYIRLNAGGTGLEYANVSISTIEEIADIEIGSNIALANGHVLVYNEATSKFENFPRDLLDSILFQDLDNLDGSGAGNILVKTTGATGLTGTANGYVAGRMDNVSETTFVSQTGTTLTYSSDTNSHLQVFKNGVKLVPTTDFTSNTTAITLDDALDTSDIVQVVEFDPTAIVAADGTATDAASADYSDMRLKENINLWEHGEDIYNVNTYTYYWQDKDRFHDRQEVGFIAQELEQHVPQVVVKNKDGERMVDYGKMTAVLLSLVKEQKSEIENLKTILLKNGIE